MSYSVGGGDGEKLSGLAMVGINRSDDNHILLNCNLCAEVNLLLEPKPGMEPTCSSCCFVNGVVG